MPSAESAHDTALSSCAREPIHTPGAIQPYGVLLVVEPQSLQVRERAISQPGLLLQFGEPLMRHVSEVFGGVLAPFQGLFQQAVIGSSAHVGAVHLDGHGRHQLLEFRGTSNLRDARGTYPQVTVRFRSPAAERPAGDWQQAWAQPLAERCAVTPR